MARVVLSLLVFFFKYSIVLASVKTHTFPLFDETVRSQFVITNGNINKGALQVTRDTANPTPEFSLKNQSGRILLDKSFRLWKISAERTTLASFNATFVLSIVNQTASGGEGLAFIIASSKNDPPDNSYGEYLGLFNQSTDGSYSSDVVAVEFDTRKSTGADDPDDNHVGINVNSIKSVTRASLSPHNVLLKNASDIFAWVQYDGKNLSVYVNAGNVSDASNALLSFAIDLSKNLPDNVYFGFSASTGNETELNCIRSWNLTVEDISDSSNKGTIIGLAVGVPLVVVLILGFLIFVFVRRVGYTHRKSQRLMERALTDSTGGPRKFRLKELTSATHNFDKKYKLGEGGFGSVYRGLLSNKTPVAVKRVSDNSHQGLQEFLAEITIISRLRHKNLVRILGWCHEDGELLLVYDLMPNGSLDKLIFKMDNKNEVLDWDRRYRIVSGVASALLYLHEECEQQVLHRDLKASNVMLDSEYNARLGDFGLARLIEHDKNSYTTTAVAGTPGYIAPECFHTGRATIESDVFSFGAVALEVACGRRPRMESQQIHLVDWVWGLYRENRLLDAADTRLAQKFDRDEMLCMLQLGLACSHPNSQERPTMRQVLQILGKDAPPPLLPLFKPAFVWPAPPSNMSEILSSSRDFSIQENQSSSE
ncbi:hypothetical protein SUGI_0799950 [Cryptomeria japonica]|uniref:probable L-type lectin-domain containing receptor kinase S.5 n=1 Tax=Cryptomeria japonica TaxID=3369 RepID=UPI002414AB62|nr:probable L-type lectin-domain containing receptor kinase S.5 [Cryptomeria japonica]GLJ39211.1 hypothetical protein SUGI_0799950 [Cryptomeria japonica]